jgi:MFS family permease
VSSAPTAKPASGFILARLISGHVCIHASMAGMRMATPLLALREGYSPLAVGVLLALFALTQVFLSLPAGRFADRNGLKKPVGLAVMAAAFGSGMAVVFPVYPVLCLGAMLTGGATGVASISLQRHVGRAAGNALELKKVFGWLSIGPAISNFIGPLTAGMLIDHAGVWLGGQAADLNGYRGAFLAMALLPLCTWAWIRHTVELPPVVHQDTAPRKAWDLMRAPMMRRLMLVNWVLSSCWDVHTFVVPIIGHQHGFSASEIGAILGAFAIAATLVRVLLPLFAAHIHEWVVVTTAMAIAALMFGIYPLMSTPLAMGICSVVLGLTIGAVQPMIMSTLHQITPPARQGEALGLRLTAINASSVAMPMLFGALGAAVGVSVVFWVVGLAVGLGTRPAWGLRGPAHHRPDAKAGNTRT